eukprot:7800747-Alexandrium_andersonii.AAC.1
MCITYLHCGGLASVPLTGRWPRQADAPGAPSRLGKRPRAGPTSRRARAQLVWRSWASAEGLPPPRRPVPFLPALKQ